MKSPTPLDLALFYLDQGISLIPLQPGSKEPHFDLLPVEDGKPSWGAYRSRRASRSEVRGWFAEDPDLNLGMLCGAPSADLVVVDHDRGYQPGLLTPTSETRRGHHSFYRAAGAGCRKFAWGELKGDGGMVVLPPSRHDDGRYQWFPGMSLAELAVRDLADWLPDLSEHSRETNEVRAQGDSLGVARKSIPCSREPGMDDLGGLAHLATDPDVAVRMMRFMGVEVSAVGQRLLCPVPGHEESNPSAALWHRPGCVVRLHCFHDNVWWPLPDLYLSRTLGREERCSVGVRALWWLRLLHEAGEVDLPDLPFVPLMGGAPPAARKLYDGFIYAARLRELYCPRQEGTPFSWRFARQWCGIGSDATVKEAMLWLLRAGYLLKVQEGRRGLRGKAALFAAGEGPLKRFGC